MAKKLSIGLLGGLVAVVLSTPLAWGQDMDFGAGGGEEQGGEEQGGTEQGGEEGGEEGGSDMDFSQPEEGGEPTGEEGAPEEDTLGGIGEEAPTEPVAAPETGEPRVQLPPPSLWAVQRIYALRNRRFELTPRFSFSMNDQFVSHIGFGGLFNWYITDVLAIGIEGIWFFTNRESDINYYTSRSFRVTVPINEYWMGWYLNFTYVPMYGKFALFNRWILHWDTFIMGGLGVTFTRPIAVVDAEFRDFSETADWNPNITFSVGLGGRIFLSRFLAVFLELRLYGFPQELENRSVAPLDDQCTSQSSCGSEEWPYERANPDTWLDEDGEFAINVMAQVGLSIFLPPTFNYRLPL
jgi:outer membrane beta-barrel protein